MKKILSFKHWQLFLLIVICGAFVAPTPVGEIINAIAMVTFSTWLYSVGYYGELKLRNWGISNKNLSLFRFNIILVAALCLVSLLLPKDFVASTNDDFSVGTVLLVLFGFYVFFAAIQAIVFVSKTLAALEKHKAVVFDDYFTNLILFVFFFVGVWIFQPKINRLLGEGQEEEIFLVDQT